MATPTAQPQVDLRTTSQVESKTDPVPTTVPSYNLENWVVFHGACKTMAKLGNPTLSFIPNEMLESPHRLGCDANMMCELSGFKDVRINLFFGSSNRIFKEFWD